MNLVFSRVEKDALLHIQSVPMDSPPRYSFSGNESLPKAQISSIIFFENLWLLLKTF
jgi:hypothetical protein